MVQSAPALFQQNAVTGTTRGLLHQQHAWSAMRDLFKDTVQPVMIHADERSHACSGQHTITAGA